MQGHKVQRLELQEVAKLGKGTDSAADAKQEDQMMQGVSNGQADSKNKDASSAGGSPLYLLVFWHHISATRPAM